MSPETHQRIRKLFDDALERPEAERSAFLQQACPNQPDVVREVERLLAAHGDAASFLDRTTHRSARVDRYLIGVELGRGAMGVVYEAVDPWIGRTVAVKVISLEANDPKDVDFMRESLFREARSAGVLSHPGIVTIFDVGKEDNAAFIAMERVEGPTLQKVIDSGVIPKPEAAFDILRQASAALDYAHQNGVVHRDVKPANIMLHKGSIVKIADFGIAKLASSQHHTLTGMVMGTPSYMSPDQIEMRKLDGRSDQFSLAVVAYELLTGVKPFRGDSLAPLLHTIVYGVRPSARTVNPNVPAAVDVVFDRALRRFAEERYPTCTEFVAALEGCYAQPVPVLPFRSLPTAPMDTPPSPSAVKSAPYAPPPPAAPPYAATPPAQPVAVAAPPAGSKKLPVALLAGVGVVVLGLGFVGAKFLVSMRNEQVRTPDPPPKIIAAPVVARFIADPQTVQSGGAANLNWQVTDASEVSIEGVGKVDPQGTVEVKPLVPTTYLLTAKGPGGTVMAKAAVQVAAAEPPPPTKDPSTKDPSTKEPKTTVTKDTATRATSTTAKAQPKIAAFSAEPASLRRGERFQLSWTVEGASQVVIDHGVGQVPSTGTRSILADATTAYALTANGAGGSTRQLTTVTIQVESAGDIYDRAVAARTDKESAKAVELFQLSATRGEPRAMLELGKIYRAGTDGVQKDPAQAVTWFEKAANAGNSSGMVYLGAMYAKPDGFPPQDDRQAFSWYNKAAAAGNVNGMDALGQLYYVGRGVAKNATEATRWFNKAATAGSSSAMYHVGMLYERGEGVPKDMTQALAWYRKAAAANEPAAKKRLAELPKSSR
jgi:serine/threonine protein kinase/TPR repeat protein